MLDFILLYDFSCILFWCHLTPHLSNLEIVNVIYTMFSDICMIHCSCIWHQKDTIFAIHLTYSVWSGFNISVCLSASVSLTSSLNCFFSSLFAVSTFWGVSSYCRIWWEWAKLVSEVSPNLFEHILMFISACYIIFLWI